MVDSMMSKDDMDKMEDLEDKITLLEQEIESQKQIVSEYKQLAEDQDTLIRKYVEVNKTQYNEIQNLKVEIENLRSQIVPF